MERGSGGGKWAVGSAYGGGGEEGDGLWDWALGRERAVTDWGAGFRGAVGGPGPAVSRFPTQDTVVVERWWKVPLSKEGRPPRARHRRYRVYRLVEDGKHLPRGELELILTQAVEGMRGWGRGGGGAGLGEQQGEAPQRPAGQPCVHLTFSRRSACWQPLAQRDPRVLLCRAPLRQFSPPCADAGVVPLL